MPAPLLLSFCPGSVPPSAAAVFSTAPLCLQPEITALTHIKGPLPSGLYLTLSVSPHSTALHLGSSQTLFLKTHTERRTHPAADGMLLLLLSHFSRVRLCATPEMEAHQSLPSLGFSRQEHWSGLPFPSPMHESEKRK